MVKLKTIQIALSKAKTLSRCEDCEVLQINIHNFTNTINIFETK